MRRCDHSELRRLTSESDESYRARLHRELPGFPLDVVDHWLVEHGNALDQVQWLDLRSLTFTREPWRTDRILAAVRHWNDAGVEVERQKFTDWIKYRESDPLAMYIREHGTWPVPIVVYHNAAGDSVQFDGGRSEYVAIEGMHRLGFLRGLVDVDPTSVMSEHELWIARDT